MENNDIAVETLLSTPNLDIETRTMSAKYAVEKARQIVKKNDELVAQLTSGFKKEIKLPDHVLRDHDFDLGDIVDEDYKIKSGSKFKNLFKEILRSIH
ncbi:MAG: hypothetical protein EP319_11790 [Deltaproteobacteria bacterium]|nr:MAG: hypothetical protein EP319_11790 [Deltaproteobacteria bacterium]